MFQWTLPYMHESIRLCTSRNTRFNRMTVMPCHHQIMAESILRLASNQVFWIPGLCVPRQPHSALNRYWYTHSPREKIIKRSIQYKCHCNGLFRAKTSQIWPCCGVWSRRRFPPPWSQLPAGIRRHRWWGQLCQYWKWSKPECFCLGTTLLDVQHTTSMTDWNIMLDIIEPDMMIITW